MTKIPLEIITLEDASYHLLVKVVLDGSLEGKMVVDTGASKTVIDSALSLGVDENQEHPYTSGIGGQVEVSFTMQSHLRIGDFEIPDISLAMIDLSAVNEVYQKVSQQPIMGLLGSDLLVKYQAKINYKTASLHLERPFG